MARDNVIHQFDNLIQHHEKLLHSDCSDEYLNVISTCIKSRKKFETECLEKSNECERLKCSLDNALEKVKKLASIYVEDQLSSAVQYDDPTIECNSVKSYWNELTEEIPTDSHSEDLIKRYEKLLQDNFANELRDCEQCSRLKTELQAAKMKLQSADNELTKTDELLRAEKMIRSNIEIERDSLACRVEKLKLCLLKYESHSSSADKMVEFPAVTSENQTNESDTLIEYELGTDWVLELSPSLPINNVNNEMAEEIREPGAISPLTIENDSHSVLEEPVLNAGISVNTTSLSSPRPNASSKQPKRRFKYDFCSESFSEKTDAGKHQCEKNGKFTTAEKMEKILSAETVAFNQRTYTTHGSKEKAKLINGNLPKEQKDRSAPIINNSPLYKKDSSLRCDICGKYYSCKGSLNQHKVNVHDGVKPHKCSNCDKTFVQKSQLETHSAVHSSRRPFQCSVCKQSFKTTNRRNSHVRIVHGDAGFCCAHCNKKFNSKRDLIFHITARHLSELGKPYKCTTCGRSFVQKGNLERHQTVHISDRSYKCSICEKSFKSRHYKLDHERKVHMEGFRFTCAHCERGFRDKRILGNHIQRLHL